MISKISFSKLLKDDFRQRIWLTVLTFILFLGIYPVFGAMELDNRMAMLAKNQTYEMQASILKWVKDFAGPGNFAVVFTVIVLAVISAVSAFSYLHSKEKVDFYHSLPVKRQELYVRSYVASFLMFWVPFLASYGIFMIVAAKMKVLPEDALQMMGQTIVMHTVYFLMIYGVTVTAMMLTGKMITGILATGVLMIYFPLVLKAKEQLCIQFLNTYVPDANLIDFRLSPIGNYMEFAESNCRGYGPFFGKQFLVACLVTLAFVLIGWGLYRMRPSETAENALAFPKTAPFIKVLLAVPIALLAATLTAGHSVHATGWMFVLSILGILLMCLFIEFVYHMDIRKVFSRWISSGVALFAGIAVLGIFYTDAFGYDTYLPEKEELSKMSVWFEEGSGYLDKGSTSLQFLENSMTEDFSTIYKLAREGKQNPKKAQDKKEYQDGTLSGKIRCEIAFEKKGGKIQYKEYYLPRKSVHAAVLELDQNNSYKKNLFGIENIVPDSIGEVYMTSQKYDYEMIDLTQEQKKKLFAACQEETKHISLKKLMEEEPIAQLEITAILQTDRGEEYKTCYIPVYEENTQVQKILEISGYKIQTSISIEEVEKIEVSYYEEETEEGEKTFSVTDPQKQQKILDIVKFQPTRMLEEEEEYNANIKVTLKDQKEILYYCDQKTVDNLLK